jgi:hypothetical protein
MSNKSNMSLSLQCFYKMLEGTENAIKEASGHMRLCDPTFMALYARAKIIRNRITDMENPDAVEA